MKFYRVFYTFVLSRRYRVSIKGLELLQKKGSKLVLPNHQSHIDPQLIALECYKYADIVPVVNEKFFKIPVIKFFLRKFEAVSVSDFKSGNRDPHVLKNIFSKVIEALEKGKTVVVYPSGQLQETGLEIIKNKQSAFTIVRDLPDGTRILGLRIKGLWGSTFSWAWFGNKPSFLLAYFSGVFIFFANLIFLCPKRDVSFEFVDITEEAKEMATLDRKTFNNYMEQFYNIAGIQKPEYVRHFFFLPRLKSRIPRALLEREKKAM